MNKHIKIIIKGLSIASITIAFQACSVKIPIDSPDVSEASYSEQQAEKKITATFKSNLKEGHSVGTGKHKDVFILEHNNSSINGNKYIKAALQNEFKARNIGIEFVESSQDNLTLEDFEILNHRVSAYSPMVTISTLKVSTNFNNQEGEFVSMVKRAKVPIWSFDEVVEPCYNEPTTLLVKEIVSKINKVYFGYKMSDEYIDSLINKISTEEQNQLTYLDVYELGFSNNKKALNFLKELTNSSAQYIRLAAISGIGMLGDETELDYLISLNQNSKMWQDRAMALKSIGDLNTQKGNDYLKQRKEFWNGQVTNEAIWNLKILSLYID